MFLLTSPDVISCEKLILIVLIHLLILEFIIQQVRAMPIYGLDALVICYPYITDILRYIRRLLKFVRSIPKRCIITVFLAVKCFSLTIC